MRFFIILLLLTSTVFADSRVDRGKKLAQEHLYDEALVELQDIDVEKTDSKIDLLFYRACCNFYLLNREKALTDLNRLLDYENEAPVRFIFTAKRMLYELDGMKPDSLGEISQLMSDSARRLDKGKANRVTQDQQQLIIDKLDKLIEDLEEQQKQQQQMAQAGGGGQQAQNSQSSPLERSQAMNDKGDGDVDAKKYLNEKAWGNLPPEERAEAVQGIAKDLPWHYREAIEAYFRKMANETR